MNQKHSAGPWTADGWQVCNQDGELIADLEWGGAGKSLAQDRANLALITAAPQLAAALIAFVLQYQGDGHDDRERRPEMQAAREALKAAGIA